MSHSNQEISPSAKILVLVDEGEVSPEIQAKLTQLKSQGFEYDLLVINRTESIRENEKNIVSAINAQNYKLILVDRNVNLPVWAIIDKSSQQKSKPKFYLEGNAHQILTREMNFINFSGVIDIVKDGKTLFAEAYKEANQSLDIKQAIPNTIKNRFNIGSISKTITAVAVIRMANEKAKQENKSITEILHQPIRELMHEDYPHKDIFDNFSLHELLTHTSGLMGGVEEVFFKSDLIKINRLEEFLPWLKNFIQDEKLAERHEIKQHVYSNPGFILLGLAIEAIAPKVLNNDNELVNQSYHSYVQENVLKPAGMLNTIARRENADPIYVINYPRKPLGLKDEEAWLKQFEKQSSRLSEIKQNTKDTALQEIIDAVQNLQQIALQMKKEYQVIAELFRKFEKKMAEIKTDEGFVNFREKFAQEIQEIYINFENKYKDVDEYFEAAERAVNNWIEDHKDESNLEIAQNLREILAPHNLGDHLQWPKYTLDSLITQLSIAHPAGKWISTAEDLVRFDQALWNKNGALADCSKYLVSEMISVGSNIFYGYGIEVTDTDKISKRVRHRGAVPGACASLFAYPELGYIVVTMVNDEDSVNLWLSECLERNLVNAAEHRIIYLDDKINPKGQDSFEEDILVANNARSLESSTAKLFHGGIASPKPEKNSVPENLTEVNQNTEKASVAKSPPKKAQERIADEKEEEKAKDFRIKK